MKFLPLILLTAFSALSLMGFLALAIGMEVSEVHAQCLAEMANGYTCPNASIFDFASYHLSFLNKFVVALVLSLAAFTGYIVVQFLNILPISLFTLTRLKPVYNFALPESKFLTRISLFTNSPNF